MVLTAALLFFVLTRTMINWHVHEEDDDQTETGDFLTFRIFNLYSMSRIAKNHLKIPYSELLVKLSAESDAKLPIIHVK